MRRAISAGQPRFTRSIASCRSTSRRAASEAAPSGEYPARSNSSLRQRTMRSSSDSAITFVLAAVITFRVSSMYLSVHGSAVGSLFRGIWGHSKQTLTKLLRRGCSPGAGSEREQNSQKSGYLAGLAKKSLGFRKEIAARLDLVGRPEPKLPGALRGLDVE